VALTLDEFESLRLADLEGLYQEDAAGRMGVSRATFGRIVESARRKVAEALVRGKALRIEGGAVAGADGPRRCPQCAGRSNGERTCLRCGGGRGRETRGDARKGVA
jgi:hypothetical protein